MQATLRERIVDLIKTTQVLVYSKTYCPYCDEAKQILASAGVKFVAHELDKMGQEGADIQNTLKDITG